MKLVSIFLGLIFLGFVFGQISSNAQTIVSRETPAEAVKAASIINVATIDLEGRSSAAFNSTAFEKDKITGGHYKTSDPDQPFIEDNTSIGERPGQVKTLDHWINAEVPIPVNNGTIDRNILFINKPQDWSSINISAPRSNKTINYADLPIL
jgi:hypothetical protein